MSTSIAKSLRNPPPLPSQPPRPRPEEEVISAAIHDAQAALWRAELSRALLTLVIAALFGLVGWAIVDQWIWSPGPLIRLVVLLAGLAAVARWMVMRVMPLLRSRIHADYAAHSIEHDLPELRHALTSYVALRGDVEVMGPRGAIVRSIGARAAGQMKQHRLEVPSEATGTFSWWIGLAVALAAAAGYAMLSPKDTLQSTQRLLLPLASIDAPTRVEIREVTPGDCDVLADRPIEIAAQITGLASRDEPSVRYGQGFAQRQPLQLDDSTGRFTATLRVPRSTQYQIAAGDALAGPFNITARDVPVASVRTVHIVPPKYTQLPARQSTGGAITAEEYSQVTVTASVNRAIERARLEFNPRTTAERTGPSAGSIEMQIAADGLSATATVPLRLPRDKHAAVAIDSYRVRVWDTDGNENPDPIVYPVRVIPDLPPEVSIVAPREVAKEVPINSQQLFEIAALDPDYGLRRIELTWQRGVDLPVSEILWSSADAVRGNQVTEYRFRPQTLGLRVGDKLLVSAIAIDNREDLAGQPAPNQGQAQPIEVLIVPAQQLPPVNAPEDGLSEPDDEPASGGKSESNDQGAGEGEQGDGQAGGGSAGGDDASASEGQQQGGQSGAGGQGEDQQSSAENQQDGSGQNADQPATGSPESRGSAQGEAAGSGASDDGGDTQESQPPEANSDSSAGSSQSENGSGSGSEPQAGDDTQLGEPADPTAGGETASDGGDAGTSAANDSNASGAGGEQAAEPSQSGNSADSASGGRPGTPGENGSGQTPSEAQPSASEPATPPQHDGDAFERIRDYLNQKQQASQPRQAPDRGAEPEAGGKSPQGEKPQQRPEAAESQSSADSGHSDPARPVGDPAAEPAASDAASDPGTSDEGAESSSADRSDDATSQPTASDAATDQSDAEQGADSDSRQSAEQSSAADGPSGQPDGAAGETESPAGQPDAAAGENAAPEPQGKPADGPAPQPRGQAEASESGAAAGEDAAAGQPQPTASSGSPPPAGGDQAGDAPGQASGDGGPASDLGEGGQDSGNDVRPPDPVDLEHARQATDLVLDYLDQHRDIPDPELLERLNWTPEELRDFTNRWRELLKSQNDPGSGTDPQQVEEALRSLGLRKPADGPIGETRGRDDSLRGLRDGGNRPPAPTLYRDAFDAFRRGLGRP